MLPRKELNIYPKSEENLKAIISFYLDKYDVKDDNGVQILKEKTSLSLNQVEFMFRKLSEAFVPVFQKHLRGQIAVSNLIKYAIAASLSVELSKALYGFLIKVSIYSSVPM